MILSLEFEAARPGSLGERFHAPMIKIPAAIEHDLAYALLERARGNQLADGGRGSDVVGLRGRPFFRRLIRARGGNDAFFPIVDQLGINMLAGSKHRQARSAGADLRNPKAHALLPAIEQFLLVCHDYSVRYFFLPSLRRTY